MNTGREACSKPQPCAVVVEDDGALLSSLRFALEAEGLTVRGYRNPLDLLDRLNPGRIDCLVLDYHLPAANGLDLLLALRQRGVTAPAIMITTAPSDKVKLGAASAGMVIVEKPLVTDAFITAVRDALMKERAAAMASSTAS